MKVRRLKGFKFYCTASKHRTMQSSTYLIQDALGFLLSDHVVELDTGRAKAGNKNFRIESGLNIDNGRRNEVYKLTCPGSR